MEAAAVDGNWYDLLVPVLLLVMMICMGMELVVADFRRVVEQPRATLVGLGGQMLLLPAVGVAFAAWAGFPPEIALGIVIITACPGGATSNLFSYLARANIALSVTLTALSSTLCFATIPFWIDLGLDWFGAGGDAAQPTLPLGRTVVQLFGVTLLPVVIGMGIRARWEAFALRHQARLRRAMTVLMGVAIVLIVGSEWENVARDLETAAWAALVLVSGMLVLAFGVSRGAGLDGRDAFTISIEVGLQNGALATMIVVNLLQRPDLIAFPGAYALLSFLPVALWTLAMRQRVVPPTESD